MTPREVDVAHTYNIRAVRSREKVTLPCASAWVALERCKLFERQGWAVEVFDLLGASIPRARLEVLAHLDATKATKANEP